MRLCTGTGGRAMRRRPEGAHGGRLDVERGAVVGERGQRTVKAPRQHGRIAGGHGHNDIGRDGADVPRQAARRGQDKRRVLRLRRVHAATSAAPLEAGAAWAAM